MKQKKNGVAADVWPTSDREALRKLWLLLGDAPDSGHPADNPLTVDEAWANLKARLERDEWKS